MNYLLPFLVCLLSACTLGPNYKPPMPAMPAHYSSKATKSFWKHSFEDPMLVELIDKALHGGNTDLQKATALILEARAQLGIDRAGFAPEVNARGRLVRDRLSSNSEIISAFPKGLIPLTYTDYKFGFDASWEVDVFGHNRRMVQASRAKLQSAVENQQNIALMISAEIAKLYTDYRVYQARINLAKQTIDSYIKTQQLVTLQMQAGLATKVDFNRIQSEVYSSKALLPTLEAGARATLAALAVLVGETPEYLIKKLAKNAPIPKISPKHLHVGVPSELLLRRPDIRMAERELASATAEVGVAVTNQFPRFQLIGNLGFDTTIAGTYFQSASTYWTYGPQISMPVFQAGRLRAAVKSKEAQAYSALATYKQSLLQALADVESALIRYEKERQRNKELLLALNTLKNALGLIRIQYREGKTSLTDVLDVERQYNQLADLQAQSQGLVSIQLVSLYKALGGSFIETKNFRRCHVNERRQRVSSTDAISSRKKLALN